MGNRLVTLLGRYEGDSISKLQIVIEKNRMEIMTYKEHLFFNNLHTNLNTCPNVSQVPCLRRAATFPAWRSPPADRLDVRLRYLSALPRTSAPNYGLPDVTGNVHRTWTAFLCGYHLLPFFLPTKNAQRHAAVSWYMYSGAPPSCNSCCVCTVMRIPIVVHHNKTRECCYLAVTVSHT